MNLRPFRVLPTGISIKDARALVRWIRYWRPLTVESDDAIGFRHPWQISARWDAEQKRWEMQIYRDTYVANREILAPPMRVDEVPEETLRRLDGDKLDRSEKVRPWISEEPWIPVPEMRNVGTDSITIGEGSEPIPEYFQERGVVSGDQVVVGVQSLSVRAGGSPVEREKQRLLRAVDVVLNQPRPRAGLQADEEGRITVDIQPAGSPQPFLTIRGARYLPPSEAAGSAEQVAAAIVDDGIDQRHVGTLWLLSPPGTSRDSEPDETWQPYGQHFEFWSLDHDINRDLNVFEPLVLELAIPLAGGVAQPLADAFLDNLEQEDAAASAILSQAKVEGGFWTV
jgi:hypothetical protein